MTLDLTSCDFCGGGCVDPECWQCYSPIGPHALRRLAENIKVAAMLTRAGKRGFDAGLRRGLMSADRDRWMRDEGDGK